VNGAIFIGTAMTATSIAITANALHTDVSRAIIGVAIVDDVLALIALSIPIDAVSGEFSISGVAMIVGLLALETGFPGQDAFVAIVLMSPLTTVITPRVYRNRFYRQGAS